MEQDFSRNDLEELLRERTGEYKMYPTERVWNSIYHRLHTRRKWHFIGGSTFALMILAGVFVLMQDNSRPPSKTISKVSDTKKTSPSTLSTHSSLLATWNRVGTTSSTNFKSITRRGNDFLSFGDNPMNSKPALEVYDRAALAENEGVIPSVQTASSFQHADKAPVVSGPVTDNPGSVAEASNRILHLGMTGNDSLLTAKLEVNASALATGKKAIIPASAHSKYSWLFHFQPSVSFRTLKSKAAIKTTNYGFIVFDNNGYDINKLVDQRPSVGFELGTDLLYSLSSRLKLKAGLQFNYSRYTAQATYAAPRPALIALGGPGTGGIPQRAFPSTTSYINDASSTGSTPATWIPDQRAELSAPLGAEFEVLHDQSVSWNVAGTFQPTYILNARAFLLSADYKSYVQDPNLLRRWNMNVAAETFLRFNRGKMQLQVGPQIRYQLMPSFMDSYPIKEHLYDIGFKIGITRTFR